MTHKYLFVGGFFLEEVRPQILKNSIGNVQNAADVLQKCFIEGLNNNIPQKDIDYISFPFVGAYPYRYKKPILDSFDKENTKSVGFLNILLIKHFFIRRKLKQEIYNWISNLEPTTKKTIIIYSLQLDFIKVIANIKIEFSNIEICQIVPDMPVYMGTPSGLLYNIYKSYNVHKIKQYYDKIDYYILLTKYMADLFNLKSENKWLCIEGIFSKNQSNINTLQINETRYRDKIVLYTGTLQYRYGIKNLIEAFRKLNSPDYKLIICGSGEAEDYVKYNAEQDVRIEYKGLISREEVLYLQSNAKLLVNPRTNDDDFTKYSFPSKIMEYFASGTPTLMYKLDGIPDEYFDYCYTLTDTSINLLSEKLAEILEENDSIINQLGIKAQQFILNCKNPYKQCYKMYNLIK